MEGIWRMLGHWRKNGCGNISHPAVVHLHFLSYHGLAHHRLYGACLLDEY